MLGLTAISEVAGGGIESWAIGTNEGSLYTASVGVRYREDWTTCRGCSCWCWRTV
ncbi:hypothetical protein BC826DRAFT_1070323, partial [Russula brevipes]